MGEEIDVVFAKGSSVPSQQLPREDNFTDRRVIKPISISVSPHQHNTCNKYILIYILRKQSLFCLLWNNTTRSLHPHIFTPSFQILIFIVPFVIIIFLL